MSVYAASIVDRHVDSLAELLIGDLEDLIDWIVRECEDGPRVSVDEVRERIRSYHPDDVRAAVHRTAGGRFSLALHSNTFESPGINAGDEVTS